MTPPRLGTAMLLAAAIVPPAAAAPPAPPLVLERAVLVMRHGIRAPLAGEVPTSTRSAAPWPAWPVAEGQVTAHGARALAIVGAADRRLLAARGLVAPTGCLAGAVRIRSNSVARTIASAHAYARGLSPACRLPIEHRPADAADPIFEPLRAQATAFDARAAIASIDRATGGMAALAARHRATLATLDRVLGCGPTPPGCLAAGAPAIRVGEDGRSIALAGPMRSASGIAQVLLLQQLEGWRWRDVGWGRADAATIRRLEALHAALFDVVARPRYMAAHQAATLGRAVIAALAPPSPRLTLFMGHDTNLAALSAALGIDLAAPGYARNDIPPGAALLFESLRDRHGRRFVRLSYRTQSPAALRALRSQVTLKTVKIPGCHAGSCPAATFAKHLRAKLAPLVTATTE